MSDLNAEQALAVLISCFADPYVDLSGTSIGPDEMTTTIAVN